MLPLKGANYKKQGKTPADWAELLTSERSAILVFGRAAYVREVGHPFNWRAAYVRAELYLRTAILVSPLSQGSGEGSLVYWVIAPFS